MSHTSKVVVYCVADEGIDMSVVHEKFFAALDLWKESKKLFGTMKQRSITKVASAGATLFPPLQPDGAYKLPRAEGIEKEPAPYVVSQYELVMESSRKQEGMVMTFFVGPNTSAACIYEDYLDICEFAMMNINDDVSPVEDLASGSDGIEGLVYDIMQHAAFYPENEFEESDFELFEEEQTVLVAFYQ